MDSSVSGPPHNLDFPALRAGGANRDLARRAPIDIETHVRMPQVGHVDKACSPQSTLFAHGKKKGKWRMFLFQERRDESHETGHARTVIASQRRLALGDNAIASAHGYSA